MNININENMVERKLEKSEILQISTMKFEEIIHKLYSNYGIEENRLFMNWLFIKISILLRTQYKGIFYVEKNYKIDGILGSKTYDLVIKRGDVIIAAITVNKILNNPNKNFFSIYKDIIFNTVNLSFKGVALYSMIFCPLSQLNDKGQTETFSLKNLLRIYNGNKAQSINSIVKIGLVDKIGEKQALIQNLNQIIGKKETLKHIDSNVLINESKVFFNDIVAFLDNLLHNEK